jgi:uncharacterized membrane protein YeaQ/YmgE (transglycosylase-associated protein family)
MCLLTSTRSLARESRARLLGGDLSNDRKAIRDLKNALMGVAGPRFLNQGGCIMIGMILGWIVLGLIAGGLARLIRPGRDPMGLLATMALGILGSIVGGAIAYVLKLGTSPYEPGGWILATIGALILLALGFFATPRRAID